MSNVYCNIESCQYRSKRRSQSKNKKGDWLYKCTKESLVILPYCDGEGIDYGENTVTCLGYRKKSEKNDVKPQNQVRTDTTDNNLIQEALKISKKILTRHKNSDT